MNSANSSKNIKLFDLGRAAYQPVWELQKSIQQQIIEEKRGLQNGTLKKERREEVLLFVEHPHVYTLGKNGSEEHMLRSLLELQQLNAEFVKTDRGGDITYHGPGQIVGYPILDLNHHFTDVTKYLRFLEEVMIRVCTDYNQKAGRIEGMTGVWIGDAKICALGIRCSRWVTMHGFAFNVNTDLRYFNNIVPCGIENKSVTSLKKLMNRELDLNEVKERMLYHFEKVFEVSVLKAGSVEELEQIIL